jgi:hypothetical protein
MKTARDSQALHISCHGFNGGRRLRGKLFPGHCLIINMQSSTLSFAAPIGVTISYQYRGSLNSLTQAGLSLTAGTGPPVRD